MSAKPVETTDWSVFTPEQLRKAKEKLLGQLLTPVPDRETMEPTATPAPGRSFAQALAQAARKEPTPLTQSVGSLIDPATREKLENMR